MSPTAPDPALADDKIHELSGIFRLMGDPNRLRIVLCCLAGGLSVGEIAAQLDLSPSLVSHHLRLLRAARVLKGERRGKQVFYQLADDHIRCTIVDMVEHVGEESTAEEGDNEGGRA